MNEQILSLIKQTVAQIVGQGSYAVYPYLDEGKVYVGLRWSDLEQTEEILHFVSQKVNCCFEGAVTIGNFTEDSFSIVMNQEK